jgi:hypothetical protein
MNAILPASPDIRQTPYWMSCYVIYSYRGLEYQLSLFAFKALKSLNRGPENAATEAQFEVAGKVPLDDIALIYPDRVKVYQVKYFKKDLGWRAFVGKDKEIRFERLFEAWLQWKVAYGSKQIIPILYTNTGLEQKLTSKLDRVEDPRRQKTYYCLKKSAYAKAVKCVLDYTSRSPKPSEGEIIPFLSSLKFKFHRWSLLDLEGSSLTAPSRGLVATRVEEVYRHAKPELLATHMLWSIRRWFKEADTSQGGQVIIQRGITRERLQEFVDAFNSQNQDELYLLLQAQKLVFGNIETSIAGIRFMQRTDEVEAIDKAIRSIRSQGKNLLIIEGEKGAGKSALVKTLFEEKEFHVLAFSADDMRQYPSLESFFKNRLLMPNGAKDPYEKDPQPLFPKSPQKILYIDAAEKIMDTPSKCFEEMLKFYHDYFVVITCTPSCRAKYFKDHESYRVAPLKIDQLPPELFENEYLKTWKVNAVFKPFFERPFLLKMLYLAAQSIEEQQGFQNNDPLKTASVRSLRQYVWEHWCKGRDPAQKESRELLLFELITILSKESAIDYRSSGWREEKLRTDRLKLFKPHQVLLRQMQEEGILDSKRSPTHDILLEWMFFSLFDKIFKESEDPFLFSYLKNEYAQSELFKKMFVKWLDEIYRTCVSDGTLDRFDAFVLSCFSLGHIRWPTNENVEISSVRIIQRFIYSEFTTLQTQIFSYCWLELKNSPEKLLFNTFLAEGALDVNPHAFMALLENIHYRLISDFWLLIKHIMSLSLDEKKKERCDKMLQLIFGWLILSKKAEFLEEMRAIARRFPNILMGSNSVPELNGERLILTIHDFFRETNPLLFSIEQCIKNYEYYYGKKKRIVLFNGDKRYYYHDTEKWIKVTLFLLEFGARLPKEKFENFLSFYGLFASENEIKERVCSTLNTLPSPILARDWMDFAIFAFCPRMLTVLFAKGIRMNEEQLRKAVGKGMQELYALDPEEEQDPNSIGYLDPLELWELRLKFVQETIRLIVVAYEGQLPKHIDAQIKVLMSMQADSF